MQTEGQQFTDCPLPFTQFKRFVTTFHVIFAAGLLFSLLLRWRRPDHNWGSADVWLVTLVGVQLGLYYVFMVRVWCAPEAPRGTFYWLGYFASGYVIWLLEWRLEGALQWTAWAYLGQIFGVMRPVFSVPYALILFGTYFGARTGGRFHANPWEWVGYLSMCTSFTLLGLFLYRLTTTSSERARLIGALEAAQKELQLARERDAELAALRERERLARDLHDSLGHGLVALTVQLEAAHRLSSSDPERMRGLLVDMQQLTRQSMGQLRRALDGLRTPGLGDRPLTSALEQLCSGSCGGLRVTCDLPPGPAALRPAVAEALWRTAQEGLTNIEKHAAASQATVTLRIQEGFASLKVVDDGKGLAAMPVNSPGHYGLRGLRERIEGLGGSLFLSAAQPRGTMLEARIPNVG